MKHTKNKNSLQKFERILLEDFEKIKNNVIFIKDSDFEVFGCYTVTKNAQDITVKKFSSIVGEFTSTRTALSWCIADKYNQVKLADQIKLLDTQKGRISTDITTNIAITTQAKQSMFAEVTELKLDTKRRLLSIIEQRLDKCISLAKYWQLRGFDNEIERTRRTTPN